MRNLRSLVIAGSMLTPMIALAQQVPTSPSVTFTNSTSPSPGTQIPNVLDDYAKLMQNNPAVMTQNYQTVINLTQNRTSDQTLKAVHDDRTAQPYSVMNGLGIFTSSFLTGAGASFSGVTPQSLTPTGYQVTSLSDYVTNINYGNAASAGSAKFGNGSATPLASAVNFINNLVRTNSSTEPPKRTFERYQGLNPAINPLDARYANYSVTTNPGGLTPGDTAAFVVPSYLSSFAVPAPYVTTTQWVQGFIVTQAMIDANGGKPITAPNLGTFDAAGVFTPATFGVGAYVPGVGTAPRPYRVSTGVNVPGLLYPVINSTNPYADGAFPSGHTNAALTQALGVAFIVPQQGQELLARAADLGNDRILAGMHSPLDVMGGRMEALAIAATNIYAALYDAQGNRLDWTNPANAAAYSVYQAYTQTQSYLAAACGTVSVSACLAAAQASGGTAGDPLAPSAQTKASYAAELTYGFQPIGPSTPMTDAQVPVQAQVLLLTRFPYLTDAQRTNVLATTGLPSGYPLLSGNTYDGWGQLNLYAAFDGFGAFNSQVTVTMDASQGGYSAADSFNNNISGSGGLTKAGTGVLTLTGADTYVGSTIVNGGGLLVTGSIVSPTTVNATGVLGGTGQVGAVTVNAGGTLAPGTTTSLAPLTVNGALTMATGSTLAVQATGSVTSGVIVKGAANITGAAVKVTATGALAPFSQFRLLTATGGVSGQFAGVAATGSAVNTFLTYGADGVTLTLDRTDLNFELTAATANQRRIAAALTATAPTNQTATGGILLDAQYANGQASPALGQASLDRLGGEGLTAVQSTALAAAEAFEASIVDQQTGASRQDRGAGPQRGRVWGGAYGGGATIAGGAAQGSASLSDSIYGGVIGLDYAVTPNWIVGAAVGGAGARFQAATRATSGDVTGAHGALYTTYGLPQGAYLLGSTTFSSFSNSTRRLAGGVGAMARETETGSFDTFEIRVRAEFGKRFGTASGLTPFVAVEYADLNSDAFDEKGPDGARGALGLHVAGGDARSLPVFAGGRFDGVFPLGSITLRPFVQAAYVHEFDRTRRLTNTLLSLSGASFTVEGARPAADGAQVKAGVDVGLRSGLSVFVAVDGNADGTQTVYAGRGGVRLSF